MKITKDVYNALLFDIPKGSPETGGILGGSGGTITHFHVDQGEHAIRRENCFQPDVGYLNIIIRDWQERGIEFCGMFHSHHPGDGELSSSDNDYIKQIMLSLPMAAHSLFFPIVIPGDAITGYRTDKYKTDIHIVRDAIEIV